MDLQRSFDLDSRLYVELIPTEESKTVLSDIRDDLSEKVSGRAISPHKWHITVIHFGKVYEVYEALRIVLPNLPEARFLQALNHYADQSATVLQTEISLRSVGYGLFGVNQSVLVLLFDLPDELKQAHQQALGYLRWFFKECGLQKPDEFMRSNHNFQHTLTIKPHLTLFRQATNVDLKILKNPAVELGFLPADIAGI